MITILSMFVFSGVEEDRRNPEKDPSCQPPPHQYPPTPQLIHSPLDPHDQ